MRNDECFEKYISDARDFCRQGNLDIKEFGQQLSAPKRCHTMLAHFRDGSTYLLDEGCVVQEAMQLSEEAVFKRDLYLPLLDQLTSELDKRFSEKACRIGYSNCPASSILTTSKKKILRKLESWWISTE